MGIAKADRLDVIYHGIETKLEETVVSKEKRLALHQLVMVGRLIDLKGHRFLLQIMPKLVEKYCEELQVYIVGNGTIKTQLEKMAVDLKVDQYVHFLGFQSNVFEWISNSDISLCLSTSEGFGLVILESFDAQTPVISFDVPACNEIIEHQKNGILVPPYDTQILYEEIVDLLENKTKSVSLSEQAYQDVRQGFSFDRMVEETVEFYKKVLV